MRVLLHYQAVFQAARFVLTTIAHQEAWARVGQRRAPFEGGGIGRATPPAQVGRFEGKRIIDIQYSLPDALDASDLEKAQPLRKLYAVITHEIYRENLGEDMAKAVEELHKTNQKKNQKSKIVKAK